MNTPNRRRERRPRINSTKSAMGEQKKTVSKEISVMQAEINRASDAISTSLEDIGHYFHSRGKLESELSKQYESACKIVGKVLTQMESAKKPGTVSKIAFELVLDPITDKSRMVPNWMMIHNTLAFLGKMHDDFSQFVTKACYELIQAAHRE